MYRQRRQQPDGVFAERRRSGDLPLPGGGLRRDRMVPEYWRTVPDGGESAQGKRGLRKENAQLTEDLRQAKTDSEENQRLRDLNGLRQQRRDFTFEAAHVIERSTSNWSRTLTLNKGTSLGVEKGDCVVDQYGYLVGVITDAGLNWSTVTTILDTDSQLGALVFRTGEVTVAMGDLALMNQGKLKLSYLEGESSLINGDMIVTSGLGGYYPSGLVIGSVEEIKTDDNGLTRYATILPKTDITQLVEVFVITDFTIVD